MFNRRPFCSLCNEPKEKIGPSVGGQVYFCVHCDTTVNCTGARCGACVSGRARTYPGLPDAPPGTSI